MRAFAEPDAVQECGMGIGCIVIRMVQEKASQFQLAERHETARLAEFGNGA